MLYVSPQFSAQEVNRSARMILASADGDDLQHYRDVVDNWRAAHQYPLNAIYVTLKSRASKLNSKALTAQRIKRLASIRAKLLDQPDMKLSQMQDIGGCRAVMPTLAEAYALRNQYNARPISHQLMSEKDYIADPKPTGYRGIHLKYKCGGAGKVAKWRGLKTEVQIRSQLQHTWATAVEAAATFNNAQFKSNRGDEHWLRFFALMSSLFALREGSRAVPGTPSTEAKLVREIRSVNKIAHIAGTFDRYAALIPHIQNRKDAYYFLISLDPLESKVLVTGFKKSWRDAATRAYADAERALPEKTTKQVVLVSVGSVKTLQKAYPNYFLDTQSFLEEVRHVVGVL